MRILIDSIDKRMTVRLIDDLIKRGYDVQGLCFKSDIPLNIKKLSKVYYMDKNNVESELKRILLDFNEEDGLIAGNPKIIHTVNTIKPAIRYLIPSDLSIDHANDKQSLQELAKSLNILVPKELESLDYPIIIKLKISENTSLKPAQRYRIIKNESDYQREKGFIEKHSGNLIQQKYVEGDSYGVSMLLDENSKLVDYIVHQRLLEYPISGGPSSLCKSTYNKQLVDAAYRILKALNWKGFAMVEFKGDYLIEINPRFWGSMPLLFVAKSSFFRNYISILDKKATNINNDDTLYQKNKYMHYMPQALISILQLIKNKQLKKALLGLRLLFMSKEGVFSIKNPRPFFRYMVSLFKRS